jgi:hypothetical protein
VAAERIAHLWGAAIIIGCDLAMVSVPWVLRKTGRLGLAGSLHAFILTLGFCPFSDPISRSPLDRGWRNRGTVLPFGISL